MPSAAAITRSSGVVMNPRTRSALAPTYAVRTVMVALSSFGYCRTLSVRIACRPAMMMTRLTTIARTGRRTKMSVNFTGASAVLGARGELRLDLDVVVHHDAGIVAELEGSGRHHLLTGFHAVGHGHEIAARFAEPHELLARHLARLAVGTFGGGAGFVFLVLDDEDRVAVRSAHDGRRRNGDDRALLGQHDGDLREH